MLNWFRRAQWKTFRPTPLIFLLELYVNGIFANKSFFLVWSRYEWQLHKKQEFKESHLLFTWCPYYNLRCCQAMPERICRMFYSTSNVAWTKQKKACKENHIAVWKRERRMIKCNLYMSFYSTRFFTVTFLAQRHNKTFYSHWFPNPHPQKTFSCAKTATLQWVCALVMVGR